MKKVKYYTLSFLVCFGINGFAQENPQPKEEPLKSNLTQIYSKKGEAYLPEADDYAIGFDAMPFLNYVGNFFNGSNTAPTADWTNANLAIMSKCYKSSSLAYRGKLRIGYGNAGAKTLLDTNSSAFGGPEYIEDAMNTSYTNITIGGGIEKRKGKTRIQGYYGGEALFNIVSSKTKNQWGIDLNNNYDNGGLSRNLSSKSGTTFGITVRGFVGVEIFVFPKVSVGAEYGWGLGYSFTGEGESTKEKWGLASSSATDPSLIEETTRLGKSSSFGIDTDNSGGQLNIIFHF